MGLGSGIRDPGKTYSGPRIKGQKGTGSRISNTAKKIFETGGFQKQFNKTRIHIGSLGIRIAELCIDGE